MARRPKTPEELARPVGRQSYSLYLDVENMEYLKDRCAKAGVALAVVIDEAIKWYIEEIKRGRNGKIKD